MSSLRAALKNLNGGLAEVERHTAELCGHLVQLRESNHNIANGINRLELQTLPSIEDKLAEISSRLDALFKVLGVMMPPKMLAAADEVTSNGKRKL